MTDSEAERENKMRYLLTAILALFLATPVFANEMVCRMDGPHNCKEQIEDQLDSITQNTIHALNLAHPGHAFRTQNDVILEQASRSQAALTPNYSQPNMTYNQPSF